MRSPSYIIPTIKDSEESEMLHYRADYEEPYSCISIIDRSYNEINEKVLLKQYGNDYCREIILLLKAREQYYE